MAKDGEVYRGLSIIEQAPLGGFEVPPSPWSFKRFARSFLADNFVFKISKFRVKHSGVSNPSLCLNDRGFKFSNILRLLSYWVDLYFTYDSLVEGATLGFYEFGLTTFYAVVIVALGFLYNRGGWHEIYQP